MQPVRYQTGNTVQLTCTVKDKDDVKVIPEKMTFRILNYRYEILESVFLDESNTLETGVYYYNYTLPLEETRLIYEFETEVKGETAINRKTIETVFV